MEPSGITITPEYLIEQVRPGVIAKVRETMADSEAEDIVGEAVLKLLRRPRMLVKIAQDLDPTNAARRARGLLRRAIREVIRDRYSRVYDAKKSALHTMATLGAATTLHNQKTPPMWEFLDSQALTDEDRELLIRRYERQETWKEVGAWLGCTDYQAKNKHLAILAKLRKEWI